MEYNEIRAVYTENTVRVYQAFNKEIAEEAVKKGTFGKKFSLNRMSWIKPSFLWMMCRCGWATKENQEHVLAIDIKKEAFDYLVENAVPSSYSSDLTISKEEWQEAVKTSNILMQWDPERNMYGSPMEARSIQLGLRGNILRNYVDEWIVNINDITDYVVDLYSKKQNGIDIVSLLPKEMVYKK